MNNLRKFETEADYSAATLNYPAVSWVLSGDTVHYDMTSGDTPTPTFSGLTVYYNINDISQPTELFNGGGGSGSGSGGGSGSGSGGGVLPSAMKIDGTDVEVTNSYQFSTTGEHIVQYSFDANEIPQNFLFIFNYVTKVEIGDSITSIGYYGLNNLFSLTSVTIGNGVTNISEGAFIGCRSLTNITIEATTPPTLGTDAFASTNDCPILVPSGSVNAYKTASGWSSYASRIQAIS